MRETQRGGTNRAWLTWFALHFRTSRPSSLSWLAERGVRRTLLAERHVNHFFNKTCISCLLLEREKKKKKKRRNAVGEFTDFHTFTFFLSKLFTLFDHFNVKSNYKSIFFVAVLMFYFAITHKHVINVWRVSFLKFYVQLTIVSLPPWLQRPFLTVITDLTSSWLIYWSPN